MPADDRVTLLLQRWREGDPQAEQALIPHIYDQLHELAAGYLRQERSGHTLQPTALVSEAYLRLVGNQMPEWESRRHFYAIAARLMRQILVDHARAHMAGKRGDGIPAQPLDDALAYTRARASDFVALDDALRELADLDARKSRCVELRYFAGLSLDEIASVMELSPSSVTRDLRFAESWIAQHMRGETPR
jgi:RNA polymerase sigma-70 factor (ECF subfamily)